MSLTKSDGPLGAKSTPPTNYEIDGPKHRLMWGEFPRRIRAEVGGEVVLDTGEAHLMHESQMLPVPYVPEAALNWDLLEPTDTSTHCPFKGDASYWSVRVGDTLVEDAIWTYPEPNPESSWLEGQYGIYFKKFDRWFDEEQEVRTHLRDPFTRVDARPTSRQVSIDAAGTEIASSERPFIVSETGLDNRFYLPAEDVDRDLLTRSETATHCPYKGDATYWHLDLDGRRLEDAAWCYEEPYDGLSRIAGALSFDHEELTTNAE
ncbi:MAG: DUF427 domain-containing protein [Solirubrobacterales bacterium]